jgi:hypothetical protein
MPGHLQREERHGLRAQPRQRFGLFLREHAAPGRLKDGRQIGKMLQAPRYPRSSTRCRAVAQYLTSAECCKRVKCYDPEIEGFMKSDSVGVEDLDQILACVAIRVALVERCSASPPGEEEAKALRAKALTIFDREIDDLAPVEGHKEARRKVIADTLDELVRLAATRPAP